MKELTAKRACIEGKSWYLIYSKPRAEELAAVNLERQGYHCYLPRFETTKRTRGKLTRQIDPMFPRYLFISLDTSSDDWSPIRSTLGVARMVSFGAMPTPVSDQLVQTLMERENEAGLLTPPRRDFKEGDRVRIFEGPFKDYEAIFLASNSNERVLVLLDILGKESRIAINPTHLAGAR